jgi:DNA-binding MarR family transcriptional regulator
MGEPETERAVGYLVKRVQQSLRRRSDAALRSTGVSMAQYAVLRALADHPDASASELSRLCFVTRQSLQDVLSGLRSSGLVVESDRPTRGRARALELTATGIKRLRAAHAAVMGVEAEMTEGIAPNTRRQLVAALSRCAENLEALSP